jgi:NADPH:quinone reductase-like Zn-dependent oxidoreductase
MTDSAEMAAVIVDEADPQRLRVARLPRPQPKPSESLVRVGAISLNRGEVKTALAAPSGFRPGWDFAGTIAREAGDGSGPKAGARVVGLMPFGAWAEYVAAPALAMAEVPPPVVLEDAATLPVAGLTARAALALGSPLAGRKVLVTGASGGVGMIAIQLAAAQDAIVTAAIRNPAHAQRMRELGAKGIACGEDLQAAAGRQGPFDLILESVGGNVLGAALGLLAPGGTCVLYGASQSAVTTFDASRFRIGGTKLYGLVMQYELARTPPAVGLAELLALFERKKLGSVVEVRAPLSEIARICEDLMQRRFSGKAVLSVDPSVT